MNQLDKISYTLFFIGVLVMGIALSFVYIEPLNKSIEPVNNTDLLNLHACEIQLAERNVTLDYVQSDLMACRRELKEETIN